MTVDYRVLLRKYIKHIHDAGGFDYVEFAGDRMCAVDFTPEELAALRRLAEELYESED